jgi:phage repressor protein C with HTH and peptisase S24 domain
MPYQMHWFKTVGAKPEHVKVMRVHGHSMERTLFDGDRVAVNTADHRIVDGRVFVFMAGGPEGGVKVKRLFTTADGRIRVVSDNPDKALYPDEFLTAADMEQFHMIGRVIDRSGRGGL